MKVGCVRRRAPSHAGARLHSAARPKAARRHAGRDTWGATRSAYSHRTWFTDCVKRDVTGNRLDMHLPDVSGEQVLAQLRADEATAAIPVIVLSADVVRASHDRAMAAGATAYLTKPISVRRLLETVDRYLADAVRIG